MHLVWFWFFRNTILDPLYPKCTEEGSKGSTCKWNRSDVETIRGLLRIYFEGLQFFSPKAESSMKGEYFHCTSPFKNHILKAHIIGFQIQTASAVWHIQMFFRTEQRGLFNIKLHLKRYLRWISDIWCQLKRQVLSPPLPLHTPVFSQFSKTLALMLTL